ncbi:hypothetical protein BJX76DRAFT_365716 [Aspergillus varians]
MSRRQPPRRYACSRCVQLKVKCIPTGSGACQRCTRLGHPSCVFPADRRGNPATGQSSPTTSSIPNTPEKNPVLEDIINPQLAASLLTKYQAQKQPHFPFVIIPPETDVPTLRNHSPFLLLCILTASMEHNPAIQDTLETLVRKEIANRVVVGVERNMDLLQGLLVHAAWYHYHWRTYHLHMYMLLQMALMVLVDLGLDRQEGFKMQPIPVEVEVEGREEAGKTRDLEPTTAQTAAGQRALLGCYYLCSNSSLFRRQLCMQHTPWINQCAKALRGRAEYATDSKLEVYVDAQALKRRSQLLFDEERGCLNLSASTSAVWEQIVEIMTQQARTENLLSSLDAHLDWSLRIELGGAPALILGQALGRQRHVFKLQEMNQLGALTASAHHVVDSFLAAPTSVTVHFPASSYTTIWYCLLVLSKLSLLFRPNDHQAIGVDKKKIHDKGVAIMEKFKDLSQGDDFWASSRSVIVKMLAWLEKSHSEAQPVSTDTRMGTHPRCCESHGSNHAPVSDSNSSQAQGSDIARQAVVWPPAYAPGLEHVASIDDVQFQLANGLDNGLWQQMLDSFTWFGPAAGDGLGFNPDGM